MASNRKHLKKGPHASAAPPAQSAFDKKALNKLTAKIEKNLTGNKGSPAAQAGGKRKRDNHDANGLAAKKRQSGNPATSANDQALGSRPPRKQTREEKKAALLEDIKALGGDEEDLDLVDGIDSDAEEGQTKTEERQLDGSFQAELAKFASGLGFDKVRDHDADVDYDESQDAAEEEVSGGSDEEDDEEVEDEDEDESDDEGEGEGEDKTRAEEPRKAPEMPRDKRMGNLMFEPRPDWFEAENTTSLPAPTSDDISRISAAAGALKAHAKSLLEADATAYSAFTSSSSTHKFMSTIMSSGTMSDKVSALTLEIQESPVHNIKAFDSLIGLAGKKSRGQAIAALSALVDLLGNGAVLPSDRRLRPFLSQPGLLGTLQKKSVTKWNEHQDLPGKITKSHLIMWAYEDWLKEAYFRIIQLLEVWSSDEIEYSRSRSLDFVYGLLKDKPEQEANLLRLLVHKLSDREKKIASRTSYLLLQLLNTHPGMKPIVIRTIEQENLLRPGQTSRAMYYAINTLNQTILSSKEPAVADNLVRIYFELFVSLLKSGLLGQIDIGGPKANENGQGKKKGGPKKTIAEANEKDTAEKLCSALLTGVNRAIPFCAADDSTLETHLDTLFRITHSSNFNTSVQALMLIQQLATSKHLAVDRFYRTLYESLLDPRLLSSSKQALYLNLLFRSLKNDVDVRRVKAFVKRMLQVLNLHQPSFVCGILYLVVELEKSFPDLKTLLNEPEDNEEEEEEVYRDVVDGEDTLQAEVKPAPPANNQVYDGRKRDPEYSNAQRSCLWELIPYFGHFHPTVAAFASNLLVRQKSLPKPDLANHTLMHFLDKFVYKNPKSTETKRGASIMQPVLAAGNSAHLVNPGKGAEKNQTALNSSAFWNKKTEDVAAEDVFFHEYFSQMGKPAQEEKKKKRKAKQAGEETDSEEEDEIWTALVNSRREIGGEEDADADMDMDMGDDDDASDLGSLLDMSDSDDGDEDDEVASQGSGDGGVEFFDFSGEEGSDQEDGGAKVGAAGHGRDKSGRLKRKEIKALPTFASADDYAEMLAAEESDS